MIAQEHKVSFQILPTPSLSATEVPASSQTELMEQVDPKHEATLAEMS